MLTPQTPPTHNRFSRIKFIDSEHAYYFDGVKSLISTTSFIKAFFNPFIPQSQIFKWKEEDKINNQSIFTDERYPNYIGLSSTQILQLWENNGKTASEKGTFLHEMIEMKHLHNITPGWITFQEAREGLPSYKHSLPKEIYTKWERVLSNQDHTPEDIYTGWEQYLNYEENYCPPNCTPWIPEAKLHCDEGVSGMVDMLYLWNHPTTKDKPQVVVCDWKRSKKISRVNYGKWGIDACKKIGDCKYNHYSIQVSFYSWVLEKYYDVEVVEAMIVGLYPELDGEGKPTVIKVNPREYYGVIEGMLEKWGEDKKFFGLAV